MANDELDDFVQESLARAVPRARIQEVLRGAGWQADQVERALARFAEVDYPIPVPRPRAYLSAREAFLYLVLFTALYISAFSLGSLLFAGTDRMFPDATNPQTLDAFRDQVRWSIANLLVAFPLLAWLSISTQRAIARDPARRASRVRKWLTYLTLFLGAAVLIGDLVGLLNAVLKGEVATRFFLKVVIVGAIAGTAFGYYLSELRRDEAREEAA